MSKRQPAPSRALPMLWLVSDARNDAVLERVMKRMPRGSGLIFRHYHLAPADRRARFDALARIGRTRGHIIALSGDVRLARRWRAEAAYGGARTLGSGHALLRLVTAHSLREIAAANRLRADALLISPVFPTQSHPSAKAIGPLRFRLLAAHARAPVIALGGMNARRAMRLNAASWAAIDGLCDETTRLIPKDY